MSFNEDALPPAYADVIGERDEILPTAPPIAVPPIAVPLSPGAAIPGAPLGFEALTRPAHGKHDKELEAIGYGATDVRNTGPGYDPEDDRPAEAAEEIGPEQRPGRREFVIKFTCPSCELSNLMPHCGNLSCCTPDLGILNKLKYMDNKAETNLFSNYYWSKITDRHFRHFFRKPELANDQFDKAANAGIFIVFLFITAAMFVISPWAAIISAIIFECDQDLAIRPLLGSFGAVVLTEAFLRSTCYFLSKIDRPARAIKELESPNGLILVMLALFILLMVRNRELISCADNSTIFSSTTTNTTMCCDPALIQASYGVPIAWLVFEVLVMLGTSLKFVISF